MVKAVLFDYNGTLTVSEDVESAWEDWYRFFHEWMKRRGDPPPLPRFKADANEAMRLRPPPEAGWTLFMQQVRWLTGLHGGSVTLSEASGIADELMERFTRGMRLDPEAEPVLRAVKARHGTGLVSNLNHPPWLRRRLRENGLQELFDAVVISGEEGFEKPDPRMLGKALGALAVEPRDAVFVGDDPVDLEASRAAGVRPVLIRREGAGYWDAASSKRFTEESLRGATVVQSLGELLAALEA